DLFHVLEALVIGAGQPQRIDRGIGHHRGNRAVGFGIADIEAARQRGGRCRMLAVRAPHAADIGVAHRAKRLHVKARIEAAADEADTQASLRPFRSTLHRGPDFTWRGFASSPSFSSTSRGGPSKRASGTLPT